jgi:parvulin-like peptidyl-prolyl isomerase
MVIKKRAIALLIGFSFIGGLDGYCKEAAQPTAQGGAVANLPAEEKKEPPKVLVRVNGEAIDELDMLGMVNTIIPGASVHGSVTEKKQKEIKKKAFEQLITARLMSQEAKKQGIVIKKKEIEKEIKELKTRLKKNKTTLEDTLKKNRLTMEELEREIEKNLAVSKINDIKNKEAKAKAVEKVTDAYLEEHYKNNKEKFVQPESTRLREILIRADPSGGPKGWEAAKARSEEILKDIKAGKDFSKLAKDFSQDIYASQGGDMGFGHKGTIIPEIEMVAEKLKVGEVAGPIWSIYGYHIIKLEEKAPSVQMKFDQVKKNLKKEREEAEFKIIKMQWLEGLKKEAKIEYLNEEDKKMMEEVEKKADDKDKKP